jgi:hypothetical protein
MSRLRFRVLFLLLVLILLLASFVFGFLTYWLDAAHPSSEPAGRGQGRAQLLYPTELLVPVAVRSRDRWMSFLPIAPSLQQRRGYW